MRDHLPLDVAVSMHHHLQNLDRARFEAMKAKASTFVPDRLGVVRDPDAFFRGGRVGDGAAGTDEAVRAACRDRLTRLAPADVAGWLSREVATAGPEA